VAAGIPEPSLPTRAYTFRRTPGGVSALALVLQEPHPKARQEVSWFIQPGYADVRARTDLASSAKDVMLIEWAVPPALVVADVRGTDVDHWSRAEDRVQVWLKAGKKRTSVELSGWMAYSPNPSQREGLLILPSLSLQSGRFDGARLRVAWSAGMELEPEHLQNLAPLPGKEPGQLSYLAKQPVYRAAFKVRPAPAPLKARALTRIEANGDRLRLIAQMDLQFPQGAPRKVTIRLRNWDGEAGLESPSQAEQRPSPGGPGDRTWTVIVPPGVDRLYSFKLIGTMPLDLSRKLPMPDVSVEGAMPIERWVAVTGRSLYAEDAKGLAQVTNVAGELPWWPAEADAIRRAGTAWKVIEEAWRLSLAPQAPLLAPVQLLSVEQEAALGDGQRWIHQASYLLVGGPADLRLHLPAGARLLGLTLDGKSLPSRQPTPESLWIGLPGTSAPRHLRLRWVYPPRGELFEEPNLGIPRFAALTAPAAVWTVHVPPLYEMTNVDKGHFIAYSGADLELRRAEIMMKLSTWLAERKDVATSTVQAQLAEAQRRFFAHLRRGESLGVLSGSANSHPAETVVKLRGRVQQLKKENARQAREHGFEKTRSDAESQPEPASGDGGERFFALPEQGAPAHGASDASRPPRLRLTPLASQERRLTWIASELLLVFLIGIAILSLFPRVTVWVRQLWPEQLMVAAWIGCEAFGVSPLGVFLFVGGAVFRLAWLAGVLQRRWHHAAATRLTG
jgi:hypothetical protein